MFKDRREAGRLLASRLHEEGIGADLVLAIPRGGVPLGRVIADALDVPLDVIEAQKIGAPHNPELAIGAVSANGTAWLNEELIRHLKVGREYVEESCVLEAEEARRKIRLIRGNKPAPEVSGLDVILVDDGVATGATLHACIFQLRAQGARRIHLAVPVAPPDTILRLRPDVDRLICLEMPLDFVAVGQFYHDFEQVSEEAVRRDLEEDEPGGGSEPLPS